MRRAGDDCRRGELQQLLLPFYTNTVNTRRRALIYFIFMFACASQFFGRFSFVMEMDEVEGGDLTHVYLFIHFLSPFTFPCTNDSNSGHCICLAYSHALLSHKQCSLLLAHSLVLKSVDFSIYFRFHFISFGCCLLELLLRKSN